MIVDYRNDVLFKPGEALGEDSLDVSYEYKLFGSTIDFRIDPFYGFIVSIDLIVVKFLILALS